MSGDDLRTWAPVAAAGFAFLAATASWVSIAVTRRQWLAAQRPYLVGQLIKDAAGVRRFEIRNTGSGGAYGVRFCVVVGDEFACGYAGPALGGYVATDETAIVELEFRPDGPTKVSGVVSYWDTIDRVHMRGLHSPSPRVARRHPFKRSDPTDPEVAFLRLYGYSASEGRTKVRGVGKAKLRAGATFPGT